MSRNMLEDIFNDSKEIMRYLRYNRVAVKVENYQDYQLLEYRVPHFINMHAVSFYFGTLGGLKLNLELQEKIFNGKFTFYLWGNRGYYTNVVFVDLYNKFDKEKQWTVINLGQIINLTRPKIIIKLPKLDKYEIH
jgi:hypothetical protein